MKKISRIILLVCMVLLSSCNFMRRVAGRPDSSELARKSVQIEARETYIKDSIKQAKRARQAREAVVSDSLAALPVLREHGVKLSDVFSFGQPVRELEHRYNLIIGVYRNPATAKTQMLKVASLGFTPLRIDFEGGECAVCLVADNSLEKVAARAAEGMALKACPRDAWIYVKH